MFKNKTQSIMLIIIITSIMIFSGCLGEDKARKDTNKKDGENENNEINNTPEEDKDMVLEGDDWDEDGIEDSSDPFLVKQLTDATEHTSDANFCPQFGEDDCIYFITYNYFLFNDPPTIESQDINKYSISTGEIESVYYDNKKVATYSAYSYGQVYQVEEILEIAPSSSHIFFTQCDTYSEGTTTYYGYQSDLKEVQTKSTASAILDCRKKSEFCEDLNIYGDRLVFVHRDSGKNSVYLYENTLILIQSENATDPDVDATSVVYVFRTENGTAIRCYENDTYTNLTTADTNVTNVTYSSPKVFNGSVVYERNEGNNTDIYYYDKNSKSHKQITDTSENEILYDFDGERLVYKRYSEKDEMSGLFVYDISMNKEIRISDFGNDARIKEDYVTFSKYLSGNIFLARIK